MRSCLPRLVAGILGWVGASALVYHVLAAVGNVTDPSALTGVLLMAVPCGAPGALLLVVIVDKLFKRRA